MNDEKHADDPAEDAASMPRPQLRTLGWHRRFGQQYVALLHKNGEIPSRVLNLQVSHMI